MVAGGLLSLVVAIVRGEALPSAVAPRPLLAMLYLVVAVQ